jgi:hypothetical protein
MKSNRKPDQNLRIKYHTDYSGDNVFASKARLLQSIWRTEKGYNDFGKYGNYLKIDFAKKSGANFLTKGIKNIVEFELANKSKKGKLIQEPRIWNNLLSSQPMAFNLFGELKLNKEVATVVFKNLYPAKKIQKITKIEFEYSPGRKSDKYTSDSSAFDVFVVYETEKKKKGFLGIEVKYSEHLNDKPSTHKKKYEEISEESELFEISKFEKLKQKPIQQIWRDHLLALSMFKINNDYDFGDFVFLYPKDNTNCQKGVEQYQMIFEEHQENYFIPLTIEKFVDELKKICGEDWVLEFEDRYLNFGKISKEKKL